MGAQPPVEVRTEARYGTAAGVLLRAAREASLLVVGSRGLAGENDPDRASWSWGSSGAPVAWSPAPY
ncbi:hypothetical protein [Streptomyces luteogriseus]|uniref:hypothetical protein n=1 Tax=Streptomyces luteogriseus TaxID=68233 RepID=UPI0038117D93